MSMLDKLQSWAERSLRELAPVDPAKFDDPIAMKTKWTPANPGGSSFGTHSLVEAGEGRLAMKKTFGAFAFGGLFASVGWAIMGWAAYNTAWLLMLFGVPFAAAGTYLAWPTALIFDANTRQVGVKKGPLSFSTIHAVQILKEYVRGDKTSYWSYELNLVLKDGERVHLVDHGNLEGIRGDSKKLAALIGCKVWDGT